MNSPIVYITLTGMVMSALLFLYNGGYKKANAYLAGFLFLSSLFILVQYIFIFSHSPQLILWFAAGVPGVIYLTGPFAYLYVRSILRDNTRLSPKDYLHFLLFLYVIAGAIPYFFSTFEYKMNIARFIESDNWRSIQYRPNVLMSPIMNRILRPLHPFAYSIAIWVLIFRHKNKILFSGASSYDYKVIKRWVLIFSGIVLTASTIHVMLFFLLLALPGKAAFIGQSYPLMMLFSMTYLILMVVLLFFPHILYGMPVGLKEIKLPSQNESQLKSAPVHLFSEEYLQELEKKIDEWMHQKHYLNEECSMGSVAIQLQIPQHHLSYYYNTILNVKFTDWRNNLRVEDARLLLMQESSRTITMEALALQCGFASQTTFNRAFKNALGVTPTQYLKLKS